MKFVNCVPGVNFGANDDASRNGETVDDSATLVDVVGDDGLAPNGRQRLLFAGR